MVASSVVARYQVARSRPVNAVGATYQVARRFNDSESSSAR